MPFNDKKLIEKEPPMMQAPEIKSLPIRLIVTLLAIGLVVFHLGLIFSGLTPNLVARPLHMAMALPWILVIGAHSRKSARFYRLSGWVLAAAGISACLYIAINQADLIDQYGFLEGPARSLWRLC